MPNISQVKVLCDTKEEFERLKTKSTKLRIILLERQDKNMFCRLSSFDKRTKDKFVKEINKMWEEMTDEEIDEEFNSICNDKLFDQGKDVSALPVEPSGLTFPNHSILYEPEVVGLEKIETKLAHIEHIESKE